MEQKPVLVVANSLAATPAMWDEQSATLSSRYRVVHLNYSGHGGASADALAEHTVLVQMGDEVVERLTTEGIEQFAFLGLSLGGMLGLDIASRYPARVSRLIAANCRGWQAPEAQKQWDERIAKVRQDGMAAIVDPTLERWFTPAFRADQATRVDEIRRMILSTTAEGYAAAATAVRNTDLRQQLDRITCPVLLITGDQDVAAPAEHVEQLGEMINDSRVCVLERCAHISCIERADAFAEQVRRHLSI